MTTSAEGIDHVGHSPDRAVPANGLFHGPTLTVTLLILPVNRVSGPMPIPSATGV